MSAAEPTYLPTWLLVAPPAAYAWQVHGIWVAVGVAIVVAVLIGIANWTFFLKDWPRTWLKVCRALIVVAAMIAVAVSGTEICTVSHECKGVFAR